MDSSHALFIDGSGRERDVLRPIPDCPVRRSNHWLQTTHVPFAELQRFRAPHSGYPFIDVVARDNQNIRVPVLVSEEVLPRSLTVSVGPSARPAPRSTTGLC